MAPKKRASCVIRSTLRVQVHPLGPHKHPTSLHMKVGRVICPPHTFAFLSWSVSPDGSHAPYINLDGATYLWGLRDDNILGQLIITERSEKGPGLRGPHFSVSRVVHMHAGTTSGSENVNIYFTNLHLFGSRQSVLYSGRNTNGTGRKHVCLFRA
ncbi:hypothetical protein BV22DRAFT_769150 [Leucogyrophana mollusca]|uniref:Uncharacterized protein n=1 Tax=Leucogyrophana mollusca TaxID=85980 RepID=A0ACB8B6K5_9AGAM|nr:hypothetical protein BV22DRAFT_769150 [Leucogyrophana mollusca]